jgi:hypothetical protein
MSRNGCQAQERKAVCACHQGGESEVQGVPKRCCQFLACQAIQRPRRNLQREEISGENEIHEIKNDVKEKGTICQGDTGKADTDKARVVSIYHKMEKPAEKMRSP